MNGVLTTFVGAHYEITGSTVTKYYFAGAQRVAMRAGTTLSYLLSDHLGSTSITTNSSGALVSELRYKPWGEVRYSSGTTSTKYQYTGQYSYTADFGLMFYNARWYDPALGRFAQADSIVPPGVQGLDRYAYVNNNPMRYTDPSGHFPIIPIIGLIGMAVALSQVPSDVPQTDPANWGNENVFWAGMSVNPVVDFVVSTVQCVTSGCDPVTYSMTALPGPNPKTIANAVDNIAEDSTQIINPLPERELPNFVSGDAIPNIYGEGTNLYRVHSPGGEYKNWWTTEPPTSELQWRIDQAVLPEWNTGEKISVLTVPSGEQIGGWAGFASYKGGFYVGGGNQVYLPRVPSRWIKTMDFTEFNRHNSGR